MPLKALIFDVDGTLADTEKDGHRVAFNNAFSDAGLDWHWDEALYGELLEVSGGKERIRHYIQNVLGTSFEAPSDLDGPSKLDGFIKDLHASKTKHYVQLLSTGVVPLRPGVKRLLEEARSAGLRLAIATTTTPANVAALLEHSMHPDAMSWFEVIGAGDMVPAKKPAPDVFNYVLQEMNLAPEQCLAFEDSGNGIQSALAAELKTVVTVTGYTRRQDFTGAALILDHLGEPDRPFEVIAGQAKDKTYFDLDLAQWLIST